MLPAATWTVNGPLKEGGRCNVRWDRERDLRSAPPLLRAGADEGLLRFGSGCDGVVVVGDVDDGGTALEGGRDAESRASCILLLSRDGSESGVSWALIFIVDARRWKGGRGIGACWMNGLKMN